MASADRRALPHHLRQEDVAVELQNRRRVSVQHLVALPAYSVVVDVGTDFSNGEHVAAQPLRWNAETTGAPWLGSKITVRADCRLVRGTMSGSGTHRALASTAYW